MTITIRMKGLTTNLKKGDENELIKLAFNHNNIPGITPKATYDFILIIIKKLNISNVIFKKIFCLFIIPL